MSKQPEQPHIPAGPPLSFSLSAHLLLLSLKHTGKLPVPNPSSLLSESSVASPAALSSQMSQGNLHSPPILSFNLQ